MTASADRTGTATTRFTGAALALLLQAAFIAAFFHAFPSQTPPRQLEHELTFFLPRLLPKPAPALPAPRTPSAPPVPLSLPVIPPPLRSARPAPPVTTAPPANIQSFGRALFGCAPEKWASLTPQQRALCPPPGAGMAVQGTPDLTRPPKPAKDEAHWQEQFRQENAPPLLLGALLGGDGTYPAGTPASSDNVREQQMETWDPCPQTQGPCLHDIAHSGPRPGASVP